MANKPKVVSLEVESLARRMHALFPGSETVHATMTIPEKQAPEWKAGDKVKADYRTVRRGAGVSEWSDHLSGVRGLVLALRRKDNTTRAGNLDLDLYSGGEELREKLQAAVERSKLPIFLHQSKSEGWHAMVLYDADVSLEDNTAILRGVAVALGHEGKAEYFPPVQDFGGDDPPDEKQINMPWFGDRFPVFTPGLVTPQPFASVEAFVKMAERRGSKITADIRTRLMKLGAEKEKKATKASRRRANTDAKKGQAYAKHWLGVYGRKLETSVEGMAIEVRPGAKEIAGRNDAIAVYAYHMGQMAAREWITDTEVLVAFEEATAVWQENSGSRDKTLDTMRRQFAKGLQTPHDDLANKVFMTEDLAAIEFVEVHRDRLRYDTDIKQYLTWNEKVGYWAPDKLSPVFETVRDFLREQVADEPPKVQARTVTKTFIGAVEWHVRNSSVILVEQSAWDRDPLLLGAPECTVDLRTGEARAPVRGEHISRITSVAPADTADCPNWIRFIHQMTRGDEEYAKFLQIATGYCLIGDNRENKLFFLQGGGGNGKDVLMGTMGKILGDVTNGTGMHFPAPIGMFTASQNAKPTYDLASARHARLLTNDENATDKFWDEEFIKMLTGGGSVSARGLYQNNTSFKPPFTPIFAGQSLPRLKNPDRGMRRRILICPCEMRATDDPGEVDEAAWVFLKDVGLAERLEAELPQILRWLINGTLMYHASKFHSLPDIVSEATDDFFYAEDHLGRYMDTRFERTKNPADHVSVSEAYDSYKFVMEHAGQFAEPQGQFTKKLKQLHGYETVKVDGYATFVRLKRRRFADEGPSSELPI